MPPCQQGIINAEQTKRIYLIVFIEINALCTPCYLMSTHSITKTREPVTAVVFHYLHLRLKVEQRLVFIREIGFHLFGFTPPSLPQATSQREMNWINRGRVRTLKTFFVGTYLFPLDSWCFKQSSDTCETFIVLLDFSQAVVHSCPVGKSGIRSM